MPLSVRDLTVSRGGAIILQGVNFTLASGDALIVRGRNGIGKTSLLRTICGLQPAWAGEISGCEDRIAFAGHADGVKLTLTVHENLTFWSQIFGCRRTQFALEAFGLENLRNRLAGTLSAGQRKRVALARLLLTERSIWVLDEPTGNLDQDTVKTLLSIIKTHKRGGGSLLVATHDQLEWEAETLQLDAFRPKKTEIFPIFASGAK
ncbi:MAG: heme ABC exporter ATP-binding protein CcmA [Aestuariivita sp.]|nr:heme ABC exporter ATP-binding protein CcmA [Aestuariivita sp.]MCY4347118.1 heme ABC exporter ATP-binding protein CcmA [Aestuariivita sp.]